MSRFSLNLSKNLFYDDTKELESQSVTEEEQQEVTNRSSNFSLAASMTVLGQIDTSIPGPVNRRASLRRQASKVEKTSLIQISEDLEKQKSKEQRFVIALSYSHTLESRHQYMNSLLSFNPLLSDGIRTGKWTLN